MTIGLVLTSIFLSLVMIGICWAWAYYVASHRLGVWRKPSVGISIANIVIVLGTLVGVTECLRYYWVTHGVKDVNVRGDSELIMFGIGLIWLIPFMFWLDRLGKRRGWADDNRKRGRESRS